MKGWKIDVPERPQFRGRFHQDVFDEFVSGIDFSSARAAASWAAGFFRPDHPMTVHVTTPAGDRHTFSVRGETRWQPVVTEAEA